MRKILLFITITFCAGCMKSNNSISSSDIKHLNSGKILPDNLPLSEAVRIDNTLYLSGQIGTIPGTLKLTQGGIREEARQTMDNIKTILEEHGSSMNNVIKCLVMLTDLSEWPQFNEVYKEYFSKPYPARSAFGVNNLALGAQLEVECVAYTDS